MSIKGPALDGENGVVILLAVPQISNSRLHWLTGLLDNRNDDDNFVPESGNDKLPIKRDECLSVSSKYIFKNVLLIIVLELEKAVFEDTRRVLLRRVHIYHCYWCLAFLLY